MSYPGLCEICFFKANLRRYASLLRVFEGLGWAGTLGAAPKHVLEAGLLFRCWIRERHVDRRGLSLD
jgi:hypothetical protein